ncbi:NifB/NifX family molybdenum-iron cluster-binding protein [Candidatus Sumerlaeota bacterium]|nr:NifB/NifX family molybdenum-iron cluster-binding protein [Candidatus Sumerlaeota bacterium]
MLLHPFVMKTAFATWDNRIAPLFDVARRIHVVEAESKQIVSEQSESLPGNLPIERALRLVDLGVGTLVCGAISRPFHEMLAAYDIRVVPFVAGDLCEVVEAWLRGNLTGDTFAMPGCCGRGRRAQGTRGSREEGTSMNGRGRGGGGMGQGGGRGQGRGGGRGGRMGGPLAAGPAGECVCPQCGAKEPHERGTPCVGRKCPKCGAAMTRT